MRRCPQRKTTSDSTGRGGQSQRNRGAGSGDINGCGVGVRRTGRAWLRPGYERVAGEESEGEKRI